MLPDIPYGEAGTFTMDDAPRAPVAWRQLGVIVSDGSGSMTDLLAEEDDSLEGVQLPARTKAAAADMATRELLNRMQKSRKEPQFEFAFVSFHDRVSDTRPAQTVGALLSTGGFDPTAKGSGGTHIWTGLEASVKIVEDWLRGGDDDVPKSAVVMVMSDGVCADPNKTLEVANRLKALPNTDLAACFFATKGQASSGARLLQGIVSDPQLYETVFDAEQLRKFFLASMTAVVKSATGEAI